MGATSEICNKLDCGSAKWLSALEFYFSDTLLQMLPPLAATSSGPHHTIGEMFILERTMKFILTSAILLSVISPLVAAQDGQRVHPVPSDAPPTVLPISLGDSNEVRGPMRLRDALRQPFDDMDDTSKPYRLSVEERQRLREQLREQPPYESRFKP
jgi:hypothetical protein